MGKLLLNNPIRPFVDKKTGKPHRYLVKSGKFLYILCEKAIIVSIILPKTLYRASGPKPSLLTIGLNDGNPFLKPRCRYMQAMLIGDDFKF
ncbi:MAG: hypothetical protein PHU14_13455 [Methylovulum sp.]|nr:hypothetical protein [Methylovulum sp.]